MLADEGVRDGLVAAGARSFFSARAQAVRYFGSRPITYVEVTGNDNAGDLLITLRIAHDAQGSRVFSFLKVSD